jgi:hypothetical protein
MRSSANDVPNRVENDVAVGRNASKCVGSVLKGKENDVRENDAPKVVGNDVPAESDVPG